MPTEQQQQPINPVQSTWENGKVHGKGHQERDEIDGVITSGILCIVLVATAKRKRYCRAGKATETTVNIQ